VVLLRYLLKDIAALEDAAGRVSGAGDG
jgi:hypothetical protein